MTDEYFFDTDCISAFLWVRKECILTQLYTGKIVVPMQVYDELNRVPHLLSRVDNLMNSGSLITGSIDVGTEEYDDYVKMTSNPEDGMLIIGSGEAAAIAMARHRNGVLASNNLRDICPYVEKYKLKHITTGSILKKALEEGIITETEGNVIWSNMLSKRRRLPTNSFSEYLLLFNDPSDPSN